MRFAKLTFIVAAAVGLLGGCATITNEENWSADHPANPSASEAPLPASSNTLALDLSALPPPPTDDSSLRMQHEGMSHGAAGAQHDPHAMHHAGHGAPPEGSATRPGENAAPSAPRVTPGTLPTTAATAYKCPMHKEVVTSQPGNCPKCGMKLVANPTTKPADHSGHGGHQ
jgi:hypothetical protein